MAEFKNPNQQSGQDPKFLLVISLVFIVVFGVMQFLKPKKVVPPALTQTQTQQTSAPGAANSPASTSSTNAATNSAAAAPAIPAIQAQSETTTLIENELYRIVFTNKGAQVKSWVLKKYKDDMGKPLDLVHTQGSQVAGLPLSLFTYDTGLRSRLNSALYVPSATGTVSVPATLSFEYSNGGLKVKKTFSFDSSYVLHANVEVTQNGVPVEALLQWPGGFGDAAEVQHYAAIELNTMQNGKASHIEPKKVSGGATLNGPFDWAGVSDLYFASIFLPDVPASAQMVTLHNTVNVPRDPKEPAKTVAVSIVGAAVGSSDPNIGERIFVGPKALNVLKTVSSTTSAGPNTGEDLVSTISFGFFGIIAKPLFIALRWTHDHIIANWGWSIILLTLVINVLLLPTRITMMKSALKMQRIQPQMNAIREKYKKYKFDDPRKADMNREIMDLQRSEGVNMFGGCLPMLIQFPILFAVYSMLQHAIELRQASWLWIPNLAAADPYHILPILFVVTTITMQLMTPSPGMDPAQQRMMTFMMPIMYFFFTWRTAAGLPLYWFTGNLIGIAQQQALNRTSLGKEMRAVAAKRAARKLGKSAAPGKVIQARR